MNRCNRQKQGWYPPKGVQILLAPSGECGDLVLPCGQSLATALLAAFPQHPGHDRQEGAQSCGGAGSVR